MTGHTAFVDGLLSEVFGVLFSCKVNARRPVNALGITHYQP
jgi:hypothetical protein